MLLFLFYLGVFLAVALVIAYALRLGLRSRDRR